MTRASRTCSEGLASCEIWLSQQTLWRKLHLSMDNCFREDSLPSLLEYHFFQMPHRAPLLSTEVLNYRFREDLLPTLKGRVCQVPKKTHWMFPAILKYCFRKDFQMDRRSREDSLMDPQLQKVKHPWYSRRK